jgi:3D (Asp-Asp-Asp) domain-containing protein
MHRSACAVLLALASLAAAPDTMRVRATAYCQSGTTKSGLRARTGVVAADPRILPVGSVLRIIEGVTAGVYTVLDTGAAVKGRKIDIFIPNCRSARMFGAQTLRVRVLRRGWDPKSAPDVVTEWR